MTADQEKLCALLVTRHAQPDGWGKFRAILRNPDGVLAANVIQSMAEEIAMLRKSAKEAIVERDRLRKALRPFGKAGELFEPLGPDGFDMLIYGPAAGDEYNITGNDLRRARAALEGTADETL